MKANPRAKRPRYTMTANAAAKVLALLSSRPEMSVFNFMIALNLSYTTTRDKVRHLHRHKEVFVTAWCVGQDFTIYPRYSLGNAPDAVLPKYASLKDASDSTREVVRRDSLVSALFGSLEPHQGAFYRAYRHSKDW